MNLLLLMLAIPLATACVLATDPRRPRARNLAILIGAGLLFWTVINVREAVLRGETIRFVASEFLPGAAIEFVAEPMGMVYALVASSLWIIAAIYSAGYLPANDERHQSRFAACFAASIGAAMAIATSANLMTLFVAYEVLSLSTYPLVAHHGDADSKRSARIYLGVLMGASVLLFLPALLWVHGVAGTGEFVQGGVLRASTLGGAHPRTLLLTLLYAAFALGSAKAALMPLHRWLPAAMVAPAPVSALLHAVAVVKAGVFVILKVSAGTFGLALLHETGASRPIAWLAGATIILASATALAQNNLKRRLAYSTISQLGYIVLAAALAHPLAFAAGLLHIAAHAYSKITLFFAAGAIHTSTHKHDIDELDGLGRKMPWTFAAFAVGAAAMIGLPLTAAFHSKWLLLSGAQASGEPWVLPLLVLSTVLNAAYFVPIVLRAFLAPTSSTHHHSHQGPSTHHGADTAHESDHEGSYEAESSETPTPMLLALIFTAATSVYLFFDPSPYLDLVTAMARSL
jgi:multicomponent Na+:H+ antiporter subunit D